MLPHPGGGGLQRGHHLDRAGVGFVEEVADVQPPGGVHEVFLHVHNPAHQGGRGNSSMGHSTSSSLSFGLCQRPTLAIGAPSASTMSAV